MKQILLRLREPSTWSGLAGLALVLGMTQDEFSKYALAIAGAIGFIFAVAFPEQGKKE